MENQIEQIETEQENSEIETAIPQGEGRLVKALQSERQQRKDLESRVKSLEGEKAALEPFKAQWEAHQAGQALESAINEITEPLGANRRVDRSTGLVYEPERFNEVYSLMEADTETPLPDKVKKAMALSGTPVSVALATPTPLKDGKYVEPDRTSKYFPVKPNTYLHKG